MRYVFLFTSLLLAGVACAKLGDTIEDCNKEYNAGKPGVQSVQDRAKALLVGPGTTNFTYQFKGLQIRIGFTNGRAQVMEYMRTGSSKLNAKDLGFALEDTGGGWQIPGPSEPDRKTQWFGNYARLADAGRVWIRPDKSAAYTFGHERAIVLVHKAGAQ